MKKTILFLSMFAWLWMGMACSNDDDPLPPPVEEEPVEVKYFNMHEGDSLNLTVSLRTLLLDSVELDKFIDSEWEYTIDDIKYRQYSYQGVIFNTLWDTKENIYRLWRIAVEEPELLPAGYSLSPTLGDFEQLSHLRIQGDERASGGIPKELFNCPLKSLYIRGKGFTGAVPKEIANVANTLFELEITGTSLSILPEEIGELQLVMVPNLSYNEFQGTPPLSLRNFPYSAWCYDNCFDEIDWRMFTELPEWGTDPVIRSIPLLHNNCFTGTIPEEVLASDRWDYFRDCLGHQKEGYGFSNWSKEWDY